MEFKNLAEVTQLTEVPEGASVLAATAEGEVVRVPGDGLGGGGAFIVTFSTTDGQTFTVDKTFAEIQSACNSGAFVHGRAILGGEQVEIPFVSIDEEEAEFATISISGKEVARTVLIVAINNTVYPSMSTGTLS